MSEVVEYPELLSIIRNAVGFYLVYATEPHRIFEEEGVKYVLYNEGEMEVVDIVAAAVYTHLLEGGYVNVRES